MNQRDYFFMNITSYGKHIQKKNREPLKQANQDNNVRSPEPCSCNAGCSVEEPWWHGWTCVAMPLWPLSMARSEDGSGSEMEDAIMIICNHLHQGLSHQKFRHQWNKSRKNVKRKENQLQITTWQSLQRQRMSKRWSPVSWMDLRCHAALAAIHGEKRGRLRI